eukprot:1309298-Pyramimonas_sp.AAC.1
MPSGARSPGALRSPAQGGGQEGTTSERCSTFGSGWGQEGVRRGSGGGQEGAKMGPQGEVLVKSSEPREEPQSPTESEEYQRHPRGVLHSTMARHKHPTRGCYHRCEHPGFPGPSCVCNVLVCSLDYPRPVRGSGVHCGTAKGPLGFHSSGPMTVKA